jgi:NAD(P)-dependent dehydrogenase (short-subunit alcohol dehydrogenase family)
MGSIAKETEAVDLRLAGKIAVVTGASRGIGLAVTRALVDEGATVVAGARDVTGELSQLAAATVRPVSVDLGTADGPARLVDEAVSVYGGLDILVNNVGATRPRPDGFLSSATTTGCGR